MKRILFATMVAVILIVIACVPASAAWPRPNGKSVHPAVQRLLDSGGAWWSGHCPQVVRKDGEYVAVKTLWEASMSGYGSPKLCYYWGTIKGIVRDARINQPIAGVMVTAVACGSCPGDCRVSAWTLAGAGLYPKYALGPLFPAGWYYVRVSKDGYYPQTAWVYLGSGREYVHNVFLYPR